MYDLDVWPKIPPRNFTLKNCLFGGINIVKDCDKEKYVYGVYRKGEWSFGNDYARNFIIFGVDNSSSSHDDNLKYNFFILGERNIRN